VNASDLVHLIGAASAFLCLIFTGAAVYVSLVEHPARLSCGTEVAARQWAPSYRRATVMQATLAVASGIMGVMTWVHGEGITWLWAALLILANVPYTLLVIRPTNSRLMAPGRDLASAETQTLLEQWGRLHAVRSVLGLAASVLYVCALVRL
jgi:hypothetical protein